MILTGPQIAKNYKDGKILISPFNEECLNPNSYDVHLDRYLLELDPEYVIDLMNPPDADQDCWRKIDIQDSPYMLLPGHLYLGSTLEKCGSNHYAPMYEGRSSTGRVGMVSHLSAGFGDIGFASHWTLEIMVSNPTLVHAISDAGHLRIGQVAFFEFNVVDTLHTVLIEGNYTTFERVLESWDEMTYNKCGQYAEQVGPTPAKKVYK